MEGERVEEEDDERDEVSFVLTKKSCGWTRSVAEGASTGEYPTTAWSERADSLDP